MAVTVEQVKAHLGIQPTDALDAESLQAATDAANDMLGTFRPDLFDMATWPPRAIHAVTLYAARLYRRRGSVEGLAGYADMGGVPIIRIDPDIQAELELGPWQPSVIA